MRLCMTVNVQVSSSRNLSRGWPPAQGGHIPVSGLEMVPAPAPLQHHRAAAAETPGRWSASSGHTASGRPAVSSPPPRCTHGHSSAPVTQTSTSTSDTCTGGTRGQHIRHTCLSAEQRSAWLPCLAATRRHYITAPVQCGERKSIHLNASNDTL